jgi:hypothetical protein
MLIRSPLGVLLRSLRSRSLITETDRFTLPNCISLILAANSGGERLELASDVRTGRLVGDLGRALRLQHG